MVVSSSLPPQATRAAEASARTSRAASFFIGLDPFLGRNAQSDSRLSSSDTASGAARFSGP